MGRWIAHLSLLLLGLAAAPAAGAATAPDLLAGETPPRAEQIRQTIEAGRLQGRIRLSPDLVYSSAALPRFYEARGFEPAWTGADAPLPAARTLLAILREAEQHGLRPSDYHVDRIGALLAADPPDTPGDPPGADALSTRLTTLDLLLTDGALLYASHLASGKTDPASVHPQWRADRPELDGAAFLARALADGGLRQAFADLEPPDPGYRRMIAALGRLRRIAARGGWAAFPAGPALRPGDVDPRIPALRARLAAFGDLPSPVGPAAERSPTDAADDPLLYDDALVSRGAEVPDPPRPGRRRRGGGSHRRGPRGARGAPDRPDPGQPGALALAAAGPGRAPPAGQHRRVRAPARRPGHRGPRHAGDRRQAVHQDAGVQRPHDLPGAQPGLVGAGVDRPRRDAAQGPGRPGVPGARRLRGPRRHGAERPGARSRGDRLVRPVPRSAPLRLPPAARPGQLPRPDQVHAAEPVQRLPPRHAGKEPLRPRRAGVQSRLHPPGERRRAWRRSCCATTPPGAPSAWSGRSPPASNGRSCSPARCRSTSSTGPRGSTPPAPSSSGTTSTGATPRCSPPSARRPRPPEPSRAGQAQSSSPGW